MDLNDLPFDYGDSEPTVNVSTRKCLHPKDARHGDGIGGWTCGRCGHIADLAVARRGKNNRARGLDLQRKMARDLGLLNLHGPTREDARSDETYSNRAFVAQIKSGGRFPGWMANELAKLPRMGGRTPILGIVETPGAGRKARRLVVMDAQDFIDLHRGETDVPS